MPAAAPVFYFGSPNAYLAFRLLPGIDRQPHDAWTYEHDLRRYSETW